MSRRVPARKGPLDARLLILRGFAAGLSSWPSRGSSNQIPVVVVMVVVELRWGNRGGVPTQRAAIRLAVGSPVYR